MTIKDIIYEKLDRFDWWRAKYRMNLFLVETRNHHYCSKCGGIMHYGVRPYATYDCVTGQPYGMEFLVRCENHHPDHHKHDSFEKFMFKSPFTLDYLRKNSYILGAQTVLDVYEEAY